MHTDMYNNSYIYGFLLQMNTASLPRLKLKNIALKERIGQGNASVFRAIMGKKAIAVKRIECGKNEIPREVEVHSSLPPHPNILPLVGVTHSQDG